MELIQTGFFQAFIPKDVSYTVPLLFTAGMGVCASKPKPASNWPLPTLSMHAPCPLRTGIVASKQLDQEIVSSIIADIQYFFFAL